jgi:hypothetical protein
MKSVPAANRCTCTKPDPANQPGILGRLLGR